MSEKNEENS